MYCTIEVTFFDGKFSYVKFLCKYVCRWKSPLSKTNLRTMSSYSTMEPKGSFPFGIPETPVLGKFVASYDCVSGQISFFALTVASGFSLVGSSGFAKAGFNRNFLN